MEYGTVRVRKRVVVLGGGAVGRLVKRAVPSATVLDAGTAAAKPASLWGVNYVHKRISGLSMEQFPVLTHVDDQPANPHSVLAYKTKIGKVHDMWARWQDQFRVMSRGYRIRHWPQQGILYDAAVQTVDVRNQVVHTADGRTWVYDELVSTLPLHLTVTICGHQYDRRPDFYPVYVAVASPAIHEPPKRVRRREVTLYVNYVSDRNEPVYRWSWWQGTEHLESLMDPAVAPWAAEHPVVRLWPGKINPWDEAEYWITRLRAQRVHCIGRFGRWNPDELLHQTWEWIQKWVTSLA